MKKNLYLLVTTMILAVALSSCQKDLGKPAQDDISPEDLAMAKKITSFITRMNDVSSMSQSNLKSSGVMSVDDALWNVEAAMNYTFADIPEQFGNVQLDSLEFVLNIDNDFCTENNLSALYQSMNASLQEYCNALNEYHFMVANITVSDKTNSEMMLKIYLISGERADKWMSFGFDLENDWLRSYFIGYCDAPPPNTKKSWLEIQNKINIVIPKYKTSPIHPVYFTDLETITVPNIYNPNWDPIAFPHQKIKTRYYYTYYNVEYDPWFPDNCLSPNDLIFFTNSIWNVITSTSMKPTGKTLISVSGATVSRCWSPNASGLYDMDEYHHLLNATYGILHGQPQ